jgi:hypothetical protein
MACMALSDDRLASIKAALDLTPAQAPLWSAVADAARANARAMPQGMGMVQGGGAGRAGPGMMGGGPLPDRLARAETMMSARLDALRRYRAAVTPFYASLSAAQKDKADRLLCGPMGGGPRT